MNMSYYVVGTAVNHGNACAVLIAGVDAIEAFVYHHIIDTRASGKNRCHNNVRRAIDHLYSINPFDRNIDSIGSGVDCDPQGANKSRMNSLKKSAGCAVEHRYIGTVGVCNVNLVAHRVDGYIVGITPSSQIWNNPSCIRGQIHNAEVQRG
jgi:hypothetical protein